MNADASQKPSSQADIPPLAEVKFGSLDLVSENFVRKYYQGYWDTVRVGDKYKLSGANIEEVESPGWEWFYPN